MFNPRDEVLEVTKEALNLLKLGREGMEILKASARLSDMFPEIASHLLRPLLERPQGAVISYDPGRFDVEENKCEITAVDEEEKLKNLLWVRIVKERYGEEEVLLLIFSPIPERFAQVYLRTVQAITVRVAVPTYNNKIYRRVEIEETLMSKLARPRAVRLDLSTSHSPSRSAAEFSGSISTGESFSPQGASRRLLSASQLDLFAQELQVRVASNKTPALITRLTFVLLAFLCVVLSLITIESEQFASETANLKRRFSVIENYQIRYELVIYLAMCPMSYNFYLGGQVRSTFAKYCSRAVIRANRALDYNVLTRLSFSRFSLNYDYENVDIVDRGEVYMTSFYYAFIKVPRQREFASVVRERAADVYPDERLRRGVVMCQQLQHLKVPRTQQRDRLLHQQRLLLSPCPAVQRSQADNERFPEHRELWGEFALCDH